MCEVGKVAVQRPPTEHTVYGLNIWLCAQILHCFESSRRIQIFHVSEEYHDNAVPLFFPRE